MDRQNLREDRRIILAHGEVTGHCHEVMDPVTDAPPDMALAQYFQDPDSGQKRLIALDRVELRHQEHAPVTLDPAKPEDFRQGDVYGRAVAPGVWHIIHPQVEYTPEAIRNIAD